MAKIAVVIYGPPGSGKTIQADLLARAANLIHFDVGPFLVEVMERPENRKKPFIRKQWKIFKEGGLCDPKWVSRLLAERIQEIYRAGFGVVLSGSLRTMTETFGEKEGAQGLLGALEKSYGRRNLIFFELTVKPQTSLRRNRNRLVCVVCDRPVLTEFFKTKRCPLCGGALRRRVLDAPAIIVKRLSEYKKMTVPVLRELRKRGYRVSPVNGESAPFQTHARMMALIKKWHS